MRWAHAAVHCTGFKLTRALFTLVGCARQWCTKAVRRYMRVQTDQCARVCCCFNIPNSNTMVIARTVLKQHTEQTKQWASQSATMGRFVATKLASLSPPPKKKKKQGTQAQLPGRRVRPARPAEKRVALHHVQCYAYPPT